MSFSLDDDRTAVRADVGEAADDPLVVGGQDKRLVERSLEHREGAHSSRCAHLRGIADPLPASGEHPVFLQLEVVWIGIDVAGQRRRTTDVAVNRKVAWAHEALTRIDDNQRRSATVSRGRGIGPRKRESRMKPTPGSATISSALSPKVLNATKPASSATPSTARMIRATPRKRSSDP